MHSASPYQPHPIQSPRRQPTSITTPYVGDSIWFRRWSQQHHAVITDAGIHKGMHRRPSNHLVEFCQRYGQSIDWVVLGHLGSMIPSRLVDAGARCEGACDGKTMHKRLPKKVLKAAALEFEPCTIGTKGLEGLPDNEEFGKLMTNIRIAAVFLEQTKPKLVEMIREFAQSDEAMQDHMKSMEHCKTILRQFADIIGSARARMHIANCTAEIEVAAL
jgi:hypothetical protein